MTVTSVDKTVESYGVLSCLQWQSIVDSECGPNSSQTGNRESFWGAQLPMNPGRTSSSSYDNEPSA